MTNKALGECFTLLSLMNSGREQSWREELKPLYALILRPLDDEIGCSAVQWAVLHEEWRPSPAKLRQIAAKVASPYPSAEECYAEIMDKAQNVGLYGRPDPKNPDVYLEGPPPMSHPLVSRIVPHLGGWQYVCTGEAQMQEGLKKQVAGSHETVMRQWEQEVAGQLVLPPSQRNPVYFRPYARYRAVVPPTDADILAITERHTEPEVDLKEMPDPVKKAIAAISQKALGDMKLTEVEIEQEPTYEDRRKVEAELMEHIRRQKEAVGGSWIEVQ